MTVQTLSISLATRGNADIHDITPTVERRIRECGIKQGIVTIFCPSSTSALTTIEHESGALNDFRRMFDELAPPSRHYDHNAAWGDGNGHSHIRAALLGASLCVPFVDGNLTLGTWQQIIYVDFDNRPRQRELILQVMGE